MEREIAAREKGRSRKWIIILAVVVVVLFCIFFFRVTTVSVEGNTYYSQKQMEEMFQTNIMEKNIISFWLLDKLSLAPKLDFVREYEISYPSPNELHIKLYEKTIIAGIAFSHQYVYFDKDGMVLRSLNEPLEGIPVFETEDLTSYTLYKKIQMEDESLLGQIINLANLFQHYGIEWDKVEFGKKREVYLYSGNITVNLGKKNNYDESVSALGSILVQMKEKGQKGTLDMSNYEAKGDVILKNS